MLHSSISFLHHSTALSRLGAFSQRSSTTTLFQAPLFQATRRHQALISSPVILLMLAACGKSSKPSVTVSPADAAETKSALEEFLERFEVFISVEGDDTVETPPYNAVSYANDPAGVPADTDDNSIPVTLIPAAFIDGIYVNLAEGEAIDGWDDIDTLSGIEHAHGSAYYDRLIGDDNDNTLISGAGNDVINGGAGDDFINGGGGDDSIDGGAGDDSIDGGEDNDTLNGGAGDDWVSYWWDIAGVTVNLASGTATDGWGDTDTISNIENVIGSDFADTITGDDEDNVLQGNAGDGTIKGGAGNDTIFGRDGDDTLDGGRGNDLIDGGAGSNTLTGGAGSDLFVLNIASDDVHRVTDFTTGEDVISIDVDDADTANGWTLEQIRTNLNLSITSANGNIVISSAGNTHDFEITLENV